MLLQQQTLRYSTTSSSRSRGQATKLAREAVDEAFERFRVVPALLDVAKNRALVAGDAAWQILQMTMEMPTYGVFCYTGSWYNGTDR